MLRRYSLFGLLFGIAFQIAFAEGVLQVIKHFLSEDPEALMRYPQLRVGLYIFWTPFIIANIVRYIRNWQAEQARIRLEEAADALKTPEGREVSRKAREAARKAAREQAELERGRRLYQQRIDEKARRDIAEQRKQMEQQAKICPHCGTRIVSRAAFCPKCGGRQ